jgi:glycosyltransferase involved in cell wall biosynthesis
MEKENKYKYTPLPEPIPITEQEWPEGTLPLLHTRTMTFMHEDYIVECIEGILMQRTTFPVQVLIHDDASTDKTAEIVKKYEIKYPKLIKAYYQTENSHSKPDKDDRRFEFFSWRIGKYEATCEGDDYWIDPLKLQKQVEFLERNPKYSAVFGQVLKRNEIKGTEIIVKYKKKDYTIFDVLSGLTPGMQNMCIRLEVLRFIPDIKSNGDFKLYFACAKWGPLAYIDEITSVYRLTGKGESSGRPRDKVLEIAINHRYEFHRQLGFPDNRALILSQVKTFVFHLIKNFSVKEIIKIFRILKIYRVTNIFYYPLYIYYSIVLIIKIVINKLNPWKY